MINVPNAGKSDAISIIVFCNKETKINKGIIIYLILFYKSSGVFKNIKYKTV